MAKYRFKLKHLNINNNFDPKKVRLFYILVFGLTALFVVIYVPFAAIRNHRARAEMLASDAFMQSSSRSIEESPKVHDFVFPGGFLRVDSQLLPSRSHQHLWQPEETDFFWVAPGELGISNMSETNHQLLQDFLAEMAMGNKGF